MYGAWYGFERTFIELLRTDSLMLGPFRVSSLLSALLCVTCVTLLIVLIKRKKEDSAEYTPIFANVDNETEEQEVTPAEEEI